MLFRSTVGKQVVYQINCTYYSALGERDQSYLLARAIQFFSPGIPQVYYMGLLAGANDYELMERTNYPRNISRHNYTVEEICREVERPVVRHLCRLMQFRNLYPVFDGTMAVMDTPADILQIAWRDSGLEAVLWADLKSHAFTVTYLDEQGIMAALDLDTDFVWNQ